MKSWNPLEAYLILPKRQPYRSLRLVAQQSSGLSSCPSTIRPRCQKLHYVRSGSDGDSLPSRILRVSWSSEALEDEGGAIRVWNPPWSWKCPLLRKLPLTYKRSQLNSFWISLLTQLLNSRSANSGGLLSHCESLINHNDRQIKKWCPIY